MRKTLVIAVREYRAAVRTKTFLISLIVVPVMGCAGIIAALLMKGRIPPTDRHYVVLDQTGVILPAILAAADEHNRSAVAVPDPSSPNQSRTEPRYMVHPVEAAFTDINTVRIEQSERVRGGLISAFVEIPADVLALGSPNTEPVPAIFYHSNNPMHAGFQDFLHQHVNERIAELRCRQAGIEPGLFRQIASVIPIKSQPLYVRSGATIQTANQHEPFIEIATCIGLSLLMFPVILIGAMPLAYSVLEEKIQRSAEVLLGSVTPFQFMMGKLLGMVGVSMTIVTIYLVAGFTFALVSGYAHTIPQHLLNWFILYQAFATLMFGAMYVAIGAACNDMKDAQNLMTPASLVACLPLFFLRPVLLEPNSTFATLASFFPPATPVLMLLRQGLPAPVPAWQPILGLALVLLTSIVCVAIAGRIFRIGILMQGRGAGLFELLRWALISPDRRQAGPRRRRTDHDAWKPQPQST